MAFIEPSVDLVINLIGSMGYPGLMFLMALDATILPVPSAAVMGFAGYLCYEGRFDLLAVTLAGAAGSTVGSLLMYGLGRWGGRLFLDRYGRYMGLGEDRMRAAEGWFRRYGNWSVLLGQLLPVARDLIPFPAGMVRMRLGLFALLSFLGSLPFCLVLAAVGLWSGPEWESAIELVDRYDLVVLALAGAAIAIVGLAWWYVKRQRSCPPNSSG